MSPWEENTYFFTPTETHFIVGTTAVQVANGNPQRVALLLQATTTGNNVFASTSPGVVSGTGLLLPSTTGPLILLQHQLGPLVTVPWFAVASVAGQAVAVIEVILREWPAQEGAEEALERLGLSNEERPDQV